MLASIFHTETIPNASRPLTWSEIQELFNKTFNNQFHGKSGQNGNVISFYTDTDGMIFELITPIDRFNKAFGGPTVQGVHLSVSGIRERVRKGKKIFDFVRQQRKEHPDLYPEILIRRGKKRVFPVAEIIKIVRKK
jgi:hypothetical protein